MNVDTTGILWLSAGGLVAAFAYFAVRLITHRRQYRDLPGPPHSLLWGHMKILGEYLGKMPKKTYLQAAVTQMKQDFDLPDLFYLDLWPAGPCFLICSGPDAAAIPTTANSFAMADVVTEFFTDNIGVGFIEATNGALWKELHQMLAPGLTPSAVKTYHDIITDEASTLHSRLQEFAKSGEIIDINYELGKYPFEVVAKIFFGEGTEAQETGSSLYEGVRHMADFVALVKFSNNPITSWRAKRDLKRCIAPIEADIETRVRSRFKTLQQQKVLPNRTSATNLLDRMLVAQVQSGQPLDRRLLRLIIENAKGLLSAGFGTTTDASSYTCMILGAFPEVLEKLREEHDRVFDKDFDVTLRLLHENPALVKELEYTTAVIHETLRMFPVGMVARQPPPDMATLEYKGKTFPVKGHCFGVASHAMHYNPELFPEPKRFKPERFLGSETSVQRNGYRPFERGVRSCMGQGLAVEEMKIALLMTARWFDFELRDHQPAKEPRMKYTDLDTKLGKHAFQGMKFSAGPPGPVNMKIRLARNKKESSS